MNIVVDTGAWYALADASDAHHAAAKAFYESHVGDSVLTTTDLILAETWSLISSHLGRWAALAFWETLRETRTSIWTAEQVDLEAAWRIIQSFPDQDFSFVDAVTFALMERFAVHDVFAFDAHFLLYRFGPLRKKAFRRLPG